MINKKISIEKLDKMNMSHSNKMKTINKKKMNKNNKIV